MTAGALRYRARRAAEIAGSPLLYAALGVAKLYRPSFHRTSPTVYRAADRLGVYPVIDHYHEPLIRPNGARPRRRELPAIDFAVERQLRLLAEFDFADELAEIPWAPADELGPHYGNIAFPPGDAETFHNVIRRFRPSVVVEIGCGQSTKFAANALRLNGSGELVCVEPYENPWLDRLGAGVHRERVEQLDLGFFDRLGENDVLFIDSSHVVRPQGDVVHLFGEVLPRLRPGVLVQVHDVFTPWDYPADWMRRRWLWTEQYLLEALLADSPRYEVVLALHLLHREHPEELRRTCPALAAGRDPREPSSLWLRVS
jgi:predicted O-methyltransferase YrrM